MSPAREQPPGRADAPAARRGGTAGFLPGGVTRYTFTLDAPLGELRSVRVRLRPAEDEGAHGWFLEEAREDAPRLPLPLVISMLTLPPPAGSRAA